jgi:hypothetical protein
MDAENQNTSANDSPTVNVSAEPLREGDAALIMQPDGMLRAVLPQREGGLDELLAPHATMIAGMFLTMKDGTDESRVFMNHCIDYMSKKFGDPV